jgi:hypothetical protein
MSIDNLVLSNVINRSKASDDAHLLIGKAGGQVYRRENATESYVCIPPAHVITDNTGEVWTLGFDYVEHPFHYEFMVLRNDKPTGQFAEKIEYRNGVIRLFGKDGMRTLSRNRLFFI